MLTRRSLRWEESDFPHTRTTGPWRSRTIGPTCCAGVHRQPDRAATSRHIARPDQFGTSTHAERAGERQEDMGQMEVGGCAVLEQAAPQLDSDRNRARPGQYGEQRKGERSGRPGRADVPGVHAGRVQVARRERELTRPDRETSSRATNEVADRLDRSQVLGPQTGMASPCACVHDVDGTTRDRREHHRLADDGTAPRQGRAVDGHWGRHDGHRHRLSSTSRPGAVEWDAKRICERSPFAGIARIRWIGVAERTQPLSLAAPSRVRRLPSR